MGGVLIADELNLVSPEVLMALQEVFDMEEEIQNPVTHQSSILVVRNKAKRIQTSWQSFKKYLHL